MAPDKTPTPLPLALPGPVRNWTELPAETRAQLPQVSISGSTYSTNAAHRMLIANGQVLQEGQMIAPGLVLESIGQRSAVLNHRGMRYSIAY
jgi:general secretion pathway protein B